MSVTIGSGDFGGVGDMVDEECQSTVVRINRRLEGKDSRVTGTSNTG